MKHTRRPWLALVFSLLALATAPQAFGQANPGLGTTNGEPPGFRTNPFANTLTNPFLNPYALNRTVGREELALYFLAARQKAAMDQARATNENRNLPAAAAPTARNPHNLPGGSASRYFMRGPASADTPRTYFGRSLRQFGGSGR
jgi:hypothetical protein